MSMQTDPCPEAETDHPSGHRIGRRSFLGQAELAAGAVIAGKALFPPAIARAQEATAETTGWTADTLAGHIRAKDVSCREVMEAGLAQIDRLNPQVNAIVQLQDRDGLLAQATERDDQLARGEYLG